MEREYGYNSPPKEIKPPNDEPPHCPSSIEEDEGIIIYEKDKEGNKIFYQKNPENGCAGCPAVKDGIKTGLKMAMEIAKKELVYNDGCFTVVLKAIQHKLDEMEK